MYFMYTYIILEKGQYIKNLMVNNIDKSQQHTCISGIMMLIRILVSNESILFTDILISVANK